MRRWTGKTVLAPMAIICLLTAGEIPAFAVEVLEPTWISDDMPEPQTKEEQYQDDGWFGREQEETVSNGKVAVIYTGNVYGRAAAEDADTLGYAGAAQLKHDLTAQGYEVLLLDAGNAVQGTMLVNYSRGASAVEFMNAAGYDLAVLGSSEFAWGQDVLINNVMMSAFPVLAANVISEETGEPLLQANAVWELESGLEIGVFGLTAPETAAQTGAENTEGLIFLSGEQLYQCAQAQIDELKDEGCEFIICVGNLTDSDEQTADCAADVIANTEGINLFINSNGQFETEKDGVLLAGCGKYLEYAGVAVWIPEEDETKLYAVSVSDYAEADTDVAALIAEKQKLIDEEMEAVVATALVELVKDCKEETNLGNLVADAMLWEAQEMADSSIVCALTRSSRIRASVPEGDISLAALLQVLPGEYCITAVTVSGSELEAILEELYQAVQEEEDGLLVSGITFEVEASASPDDNTEYNITVTSVGGRAFSAKAQYQIAVDDGMTAGMSGLLSEIYAENGRTTGILLSEALDGFVTEELDGVIDETYKSAQGRIVLK